MGVGWAGPVITKQASNQTCEASRHKSSKRAITYTRNRMTECRVCILEMGTYATEPASERGQTGGREQAKPTPRIMIPATLVNCWGGGKTDTRGERGRLPVIKPKVVDGSCYIIAVESHKSCASGAHKQLIPGTRASMNPGVGGLLVTSSSPIPSALGGACTCQPAWHSNPSPNPAGLHRPRTRRRFLGSQASAGSESGRPH